MMKIIRQIFVFTVIPLTIIFYFADYFFNNEVQIYKHLFNIFLTGSVGFYTNFLAIKLLFKPQNPTSILKLQGLLPKNKEIIAKEFGTQIKTQFLNTTDLAIYALEEKIDEKIVKLIFKYLHSEKVFDKMIEYSKSNNSENINLKLNSKELFNKIIPHLISLFENKKEELADFIYRRLIKHKNWFKRQFLPSKDNISSFLNRINNDELQSEMSSLIENNLHNIIQVIIKDLLNDQQFINELKINSNNIINYTENHIKSKYLNKGLIFTFLLENLDDLLKHVRFDKIISSKIGNYDINSFEEMINKLVKKHLSFIELSGGILGLIAGIALVNIPVFLTVIAITSLLVGFDVLISNNKKSVNNSVTDDDVIKLCAIMIRKDLKTKIQETIAFDNFYDEISKRFNFKNPKDKNVMKFAQYTAENSHFKREEEENLIQKIKQNENFDYLKQRLFILAISDNELHENEKRMIETIRENEFNT